MPGTPTDPLTQPLVPVPPKQHLCSHPPHSPDVALRPAGDRDLAKALFRQQHQAKESDSDAIFGARGLLGRTDPWCHGRRPKRKETRHFPFPLEGGSTAPKLAALRRVCHSWWGWESRLWLSLCSAQFPQVWAASVDLLLASWEPRQGHAVTVPQHVTQAVSPPTTSPAASRDTPQCKMLLPGRGLGTSSHAQLLPRDSPWCQQPLSSLH